MKWRAKGRNKAGVEHYLGSCRWFCRENLIELPHPIPPQFFCCICYVDSLFHLLVSLRKDMTTSRSGRITLVSRRVFEVVRNILRFDADIYYTKGEIYVSFFLSRFCLEICSFLSPRIICISCLFHVQQIFFCSSFWALSKSLNGSLSALNKHLARAMTLIRLRRLSTVQDTLGRLHLYTYIYIYLPYLLTYSKNQSFMDEYTFVPWILWAYSSSNYCWWKKFCTSWYGKYPISCRVSYMLHVGWCRISSINSIVREWSGRPITSETHIQKWRTCLLFRWNKVEWC